MILQSLARAYGRQIVWARYIRILDPRYVWSFAGRLVLFPAAYAVIMMIWHCTESFGIWTTQRHSGLYFIALLSVRIKSISFLQDAVYGLITATQLRHSSWAGIIAVQVVKFCAAFISLCNACRASKQSVAIADHVISTLEGLRVWLNNGGASEMLDWEIYQNVEMWNYKYDYLPSYPDWRLVMVGSVSNWVDFWAVHYSQR